MACFHSINKNSNLISESVPEITVEALSKNPKQLGIGTHNLHCQGNNTFDICTEMKSKRIDILAAQETNVVLKKSLADHNLVMINNDYLDPEDPFKRVGFFISDHLVGFFKEVKQITDPKKNIPTYTKMVILDVFTEPNIRIFNIHSVNNNKGFLPQLKELITANSIVLGDFNNFFQLN